MGGEYYPVHSQIVTVCPGFAAPRCAVTPPAGELQRVHWVRSILWLKRQDTHSTSEALCTFIQQRDIKLHRFLWSYQGSWRQHSGGYADNHTSAPITHLAGGYYLKEGQLVSCGQLLIELGDSAVDGLLHRWVITEDQDTRRDLRYLLEGQNYDQHRNRRKWLSTTTSTVYFFNDIYDIYFNETIWDWSCTPEKFTEVKFVLFSTLPKYFHLLLPDISEEILFFLFNHIYLTALFD